jgi:hypothetical protein
LVRGVGFTGHQATPLPHGEKRTASAPAPAAAHASKGARGQKRSAAAMQKAVDPPAAKPRQHGTTKHYR